VTAAQRDAARTKGCSTTGTFRTLISGRVPGVEGTIAHGGSDEKWVRLAIDAEIPDGASVSALYRSGPGPLSLGAQNADPTAIAQDEEYAEIEGTLTSNGLEPVRIASGGAALTYTTFTATLLRADRSSLPGGSVVIGLDRAYDRPDYRTDPVAGRSRPAPLTDRIGRLDGFEIELYSAEGVREFKETMLDVEWVIEHPAANAMHRVRLYEISEAAPMESERPEEALPFRLPVGFSVSRAEVLETGALR